MESNRIGVAVAQNSHGFSRGSCVFFDGSNWVLATTGGPNLAVVGDAISGNAFEAVMLGELDGLDGLTPGATYYVGAAGTLSTTPNGPAIGQAYTASVLLVSVAQGAESSSAAVDTSQFASRSELVAGLATEVSRADAAYDRSPSNATLTYTGDVLTSYADAYGTKAFAYDVNGRMTGWTGTGAYRSCTLGYTGELLTSKTYS